jgi:hypothetical protein
MKRCLRCRGKLGLGIRFRWRWNRHAWSYETVRFCSAYCEAWYFKDEELEARRRRHIAYLSRPG